MASDDQRREMAQELRVAASGAYRHVCSLDVIATTIGVDPQGKFEREVEQETYATLADLIDRPTCQMKSIPTSSYRACSRCGAFVREDALTNLTEAIPARFCPNCGAKVTEKEEVDGNQ